MAGRNFQYTKGYIYLIRNRINGKCYAGQSTISEKRPLKHLTNQGSKLVGAAVEKYKIENFEYGIIVINLVGLLFDEIIEKMNSEEQHLIDFHNCIAPNGYNISPIAGSSLGVSLERSSEYCAAISKRMIGNKHAAGAVFSDERRSKISKALTGKKKSPEHRAKMSKPLTAEHRANISKSRSRYYFRVKNE